MSFLALCVFVFCLWAVFSHRFVDGIIAKNLLVFAAIAASMVYLNPSNFRAAAISAFCLIAGVVYWYCRKDSIRNSYEQHLFHRRRSDRKA